jgi:hypothetical protein
MKVIYYVSSIKEMFPDDIEDKSIYYYTGKELIKLDK